VVRKKKKKKEMGRGRGVTCMVVRGKEKKNGVIKK
jgi:hypothetical protein